MIRSMSIRKVVMIFFTQRKFRKGLIQLTATNKRVEKKWREM